MSSDIEIEIHVRIVNSKELMEFLKSNAKFIGLRHQIDKYFVPVHRDFLAVKPVKEWLRLRNSSGKCSVNYKNWHYEKDGKSYFSDEYESQVESPDIVQKIFIALNFREIVTVDKIRKIYYYQDYEVDIDSVKKLGEFVEIEYQGKPGTKTPAQLTSDMITFLKGFNPGKITRNYQGYPFQILFPEEVKSEEY